MANFTPPVKGGRRARAAYTVEYLRDVAASNRNLATMYSRQPDNKQWRYYSGRAEAFEEAADCLVKIGL